LRDDMAVLLKQVAARAGVSVPTASLILSGKGDRYGAPTQKRVWKAAQALAYRSNLSSRGLRQRKSLLLGVMLYSVNTSLFANVLSSRCSATSSTGSAP
jgi:LacI family transcriptional regulator